MEELNQSKMMPIQSHNEQSSNEQVEETHFADDPMIDIEHEAIFLPHSEQSVFGVDNRQQYKEHLVQSNFHARLLHHLNQDLLPQPNLESKLTDFIKAKVCVGAELSEIDHQIQGTHVQLERLRTQLSKLENQVNSEAQQDQIREQIIDLCKQQDKRSVQADALVFKIHGSSASEKTDLLKIIRGVPMSGGVDYVSQTEMLEQMNGALVSLMQGVQEQNQALVDQLMKANSANNDHSIPVMQQEAQRLAEHRAQTEDVARQRHLWVQQLGHTTLDDAQLGGVKPFVSASDIEKVIDDPAALNQMALVGHTSILQNQQLQATQGLANAHHNQVYQHHHLNQSDKQTTVAQPEQIKEHHQSVATYRGMNAQAEDYLRAGASSKLEHASQYTRLDPAQLMALNAGASQSNKVQQQVRDHHGSSYGDGIADPDGSSYMAAMQHGGSGAYGKGSGAAGGEGGDKPKKRIRRTANQINRRFICICGKAYGSEGSLNQHKKNKGHFGEDGAMKIMSPSGISRPLHDLVGSGGMMHGDNVSGISSSREQSVA